MTAWQCSSSRWIGMLLPRHRLLPLLVAVSGSFVASGLLSEVCQAQVRPPGTDVGPVPFAPVLAEATLDSVWSRVQNTHYDAELGGLDWEGVREELLPRARAASSTVELRTILGEMLGRLGESHFAIIPAASAPAFEPSARPRANGGGDPGIDVRWIEETLLITRVREGSPADRAGVAIGWIVEGLGDLPVDTLAHWIREAAEPGAAERDLVTWLPVGARSRLLGVEGTSIELSLRDHRDEPHSLVIPRAAPPGDLVVFGNLPPLRIETEHRVESLEGGVQVGVIRLSAWFPVAVSAIAEAVDELRTVDAIVLDLRGNPGGIGGLVMGIGGHFLRDPLSLGTMRTRDTSLRFVVNPQRVSPDGRRVEPYAGPLAILVDPLTASTSEIFAGGLQAVGRATVIGETTAGQALPALVVRLPNGDRLIHAVADFRTPNGSRLEGNGVRPDIPVTLNRSSFLGEHDPVLTEAFRWILDQEKGLQR